MEGAGLCSDLVSCPALWCGLIVNLLTALANNECGLHLACPSVTGARLSGGRWGQGVAGQPPLLSAWGPPGKLSAGETEGGRGSGMG